MDCNTGKIYELQQAEAREMAEELHELEKEAGRRLAPLSERQHEELKPMGNIQRKGYMRNQPCVCGSGKKFKRCCWSKYA